MKGVIFMSEKKIVAKSRKWQITINNPLEHNMSHDEIKKILNTLPSLIYWCMADEKGLKENTPHTHLYICLKNGIRFTTLQKKFPKAHIENAVDTSAHNRDYILKDGKWKDTAKNETSIEGTFEESGTLPNNEFTFASNQQFYGTLYQLINDGLTDGEIIAYNPNYIPHLKQFQLIRNAINEGTCSYRCRDLEIHYIYGANRWSKIEEIRNKYGYENVYSISDYERPFDDYSSQEVIIFEEYQDSLPFLTLNHYLQNYPFKVGSNPNKKSACYTKVYIVSDIPVQKQYANEQVNFDNYTHLFLDKINSITYCKDTDTEITHDMNVYYVDDEEFLPFWEDTTTP